jgi:branched-subunit amino acid aminotransferase/4-amino-4-deoxychorismate lyase
MSETFLGVANINGQFQSLQKAKIPLSDRGFLFGHSIFETLLVKNGKIIQWDQHFSRMKLSCTGAFIKIPNENILKKLAQETVQENIKKYKIIAEKAQLKIIISGGNSFIFPILRKNKILPQSNIIIICRNINTDFKRSNSLSLKTLLDLRSSGLIEIKSCNYLYNLIALEMSRHEGFDDALFYNANGIVTECTTANFLWFDKEFCVYSTPFQGTCLAGTTLMSLIRGMKKNKIMFSWKELHRANISGIAGCAMISSVRSLVPVQKIDTISFPVDLQKEFFEKLFALLQDAESEES